MTVLKALAVIPVMLCSQLMAIHPKDQVWKDAYLKDADLSVAHFKMLPETSLHDSIVKQFYCAYYLYRIDHKQRAWDVFRIVDDLIEGQMANPSPTQEQPKEQHQ